VTCGGQDSVGAWARCGAYHLPLTTADGVRSVVHHSTSPESQLSSIRAVVDDVIA
jgi:hypothetical protein